MRGDRAGLEWCEGERTSDDCAIYRCRPSTWYTTSRYLLPIDMWLVGIVVDGGVDRGSDDMVISTRGALGTREPMKVDRDSKWL